MNMVNWFEWRKDEVEVGGTVDWRSTGRASISQAYIADLPDWFQHAQAPTSCAPTPG